MLSCHIVQNVVRAKFSNPKILDVLKCIAEQILQRFIAMLSKFYTANILHYTGILASK